MTYTFPGVCAPAGNKRLRKEGEQVPVPPLSRVFSCILRITLSAALSTASVTDCRALPASVLGRALGRRSMSAAMPATAPTAMPRRKEPIVIPLTPSL